MDTTNNLTKKQLEILTLLYRFRFLNRLQIQKLLNQKHFKRIIINLNQLTATNHIRRDYNPKTVTIPAIYSLGLEGRKYLKKSDLKGINKTLLDRVWQEKKLSNQFKKHCLLIADIFLSLIVLTEKSRSVLNFRTKTELSSIKDLISSNPDAYFSLTKANGSKKRYFLDIFNDWPPRMYLRKRVNQYFEFYQTNIWQNHQTDPFPQIILVCPEDRSKRYLNKYIKKKLDSELEPQFYLSTSDQIKTKGLIREVLEKVET
jgi:hypothetical protein